MASTNLSLFSPQRTRMGVVLGNGQARVTRREIEQVAAPGGRQGRWVRVSEPL